MSDRLIEECSKIRREKCGQLRPVLDSEGNCSYVNASIHGLFACEVFRIRVIRQGMKNKHLFYQYYLANLFIRMTIGMKKMYSTAELRDKVSANNPRFHSGSEHDPLDFIQVLLDLLHQSSDVGSATATLVTDSFRGIFNMTMTCSNNHSWTTTEHFNVASLHVPYTPQPTKLQKLIRFIGNFPMDVNIKCNNCDSMQVSARKTFNYTADHLILHLQRVNEEEVDKKSKVFVEDVITVLKQQYNLVAIICFHKKRGVLQAYSCYSKLGQTWYQFRRNYVIEEQTGILDNQIVMENAHILFYRKSSIAGKYDDIDRRLRAMRASASQSQPTRPRSDTTLPVDGESAFGTDREFNLIHATLGRRSGVGLRNLGNTCYMNATLQALFHCEEFRLQILFGQHNGRFHNLLKRLFQELLYTKESNISPDQFRRNFVAAFPNFVKGLQHDAMEFFIALIETLYAEANVVKEDTKQSDTDSKTSEQWWQQFLIYTKNSYLVDIFSMQTEYRFVCISCNGSWSRFGDSCFILLVMPENLGQNAIDVQTVINNSMMPELVEVRCVRCQSGNEANRALSICRHPRVLVVQLQCTVFDMNTYKASKLNLNLEVNEFITINNERYSCFACVIHHGKTADSGHYTAFCKRGDNWHYFNDMVVNLSSTGKFPEDPNVKNTYFLLYDRLSAKTELKGSSDVSGLDFGGIIVPHDSLGSGSRTDSMGGASRRRGGGKGKAPGIPRN